MSHVDKRPNGCWEFTGATMPFGHGQVNLAGGERWLAHRLSWEVYVGPIPEGLSVCHKCDNPPCVNPDHLFLGTHLDNMTDAADKGRMGRRKGVVSTKPPRPPRNKLNEEQVVEILHKLKDGRTQYEVANEYGATRSAIGGIAQNRHWKHIPRP